MGEQWNNQTMEYYSVLNMLSNHEKKLKNLKCILLSSKEDKLSNCMTV